MSEQEDRGEIALIEEKSARRWTVIDYIVFTGVIMMIARGYVEAGVLLATQWFPDIGEWFQQRSK